MSRGKTLVIAMVSVWVPVLLTGIVVSVYRLTHPYKIENDPIYAKLYDLEGAFRKVQRGSPKQEIISLLGGADETK